MNFSKFGRSLRTFGQKLSHGVRAVGNKVGNFLLDATPVLAAIPGIGPEAAAFTGTVGSGIVGAAHLAGMAEDALKGNKVDFGGAVKGARAVAEGASAVRDAYRRARGRGSAIERGG